MNDHVETDLVVKIGNALKAANNSAENVCRAAAIISEPEGSEQSTDWTLIRKSPTITTTTFCVNQVTRDSAGAEALDVVCKNEFLAALNIW
jgi:hypothetical protein